MFTDKELKVAKMKLEGLMNVKIAETLKVSEADISQTLSRLTRKVKSVQDSTKLLIDTGLLQEGPKYIMTEKGRKLSSLPNKKTPLQTGCNLARVSTVVFKGEDIEETSGALFVTPYPSLALWKGTAITVPKISSAGTRVPSSNPLVVSLIREQAQSTEPAL